MAVKLTGVCHIPSCLIGSPLCLHFTTDLALISQSWDRWLRFLLALFCLREAWTYGPCSLCVWKPNWTRSDTIVTLVDLKFYSSRVIPCPWEHLWVEILKTVAFRKVSKWAQFLVLLSSFPERLGAEDKTPPSQRHTCECRYSRLRVCFYSFKLTEPAQGPPLPHWPSDSFRMCEVLL